MLFMKKEYTQEEMVTAYEQSDNTVSVTEEGKGTAGQLADDITEAYFNHTHLICEFKHSIRAVALFAILMLLTSGFMAWVSFA